jgi:excinuclease ABC subunit B
MRAGGILDADKEGFLRSETSLIQTIGRAARNVDGRVILYADRITGSMERAMAETDRRREKQQAYNEAHGITPTTIKRNIGDIIADVSSRDGLMVEIDESTPHLVGHNLRSHIEDLEKKMRAAAADLEFEEAARLRDEIKQLEASELGLPAHPQANARPLGRATEGKPGTRKLRFGKTQRKF